jgi:hypothetical protein
MPIQVKCDFCGDTVFRVAHIHPFTDFNGDEIEAAHEPSNLVALCELYHSRWKGILLCSRLI